MVKKVLFNELNKSNKPTKSRMLDIDFIRQNKDIVKDAAKKKGIAVDVDALLLIDAERREHIHHTDELRAQQNLASEQIAREKDAGKRTRAIGQMKRIKNDIQEAEKHFQELELRYRELMFAVPNIPFDDVPVGKDEKDNVVLREVGSRPDFNFEPLDYLALSEKHGWIDVERAAKVSGSRFGYIRGDLALLEFAIVQYALRKLVDRGFIPVVPPVMIKPEYMQAMGFLQGDTKDDAYFLEKDELYLTGTSEQSIGPMHAGEILEREKLPLRYVGFSSCFRREAGSYGRDTRGILRVHQFDKLEMISFCEPDASRGEHRFLLGINEEMMKELGLPYRVVHVCTGDMGLVKAEQFDIETWVPSEGRYRETHSASNTTDFQARRLGIRTRDEGGETVFVHMLNDTVFALGRILIAIIENFQQKDGTVLLPETLIPFMGGISKIPHA